MLSMENVVNRSRNGKT